MPKEIIYTQRVQFGDCDPARIVWFPNFFRWIDAASQYFFEQCGVPPWHEVERATGVIGTPLVDTQARFVKAASYGDTLDIHVTIKEWRAKSFVQSYRITRAQVVGDAAVQPPAGPDLIMEYDEVRIFAARRDDGKNGIRAVPVPESIRRLCE